MLTASHLISQFLSPIFQYSHFIRKNSKLCFVFYILKSTAKPLEPKHVYNESRPEMENLMLPIEGTPYTSAC